MRLAVLAVLALLGTSACGQTEERPGGAALANLTVRVDRDGRGPQPARILHVRCDRPDQSEACGAAAGVSDADLAPTPPGRACSQIYGGPQTAAITGTLRHETVSAVFSRTDGCQVARWDGVRDLLDQVR